MGALDNFTPTTNSDNRPRIVEDDHTDTIIRGGTCYHIFELPFKWSTTVATESSSIVGTEFYNCVSYLSGIERVLDKFQAKSEFHQIDETTKAGVTFVTIKLTPAETVLFKPLRETKAQLRLKLLNTDVIFTKEMPIKVIDTIQEADIDEYQGVVEASMGDLIKLVQ